MPSSFGLGRQSTSENLAGLKWKVSYGRQLRGILAGSQDGGWHLKGQSGSLKTNSLEGIYGSEAGGGLKGAGEA